ncbi:hypothetical protein MAJ_04694, partial [Metarhizium majus ARSEF 297]
MAPPSPLHFLHLPSEIRHAVYNAYVDVDGGYLVNPRTDKLVAATGNQKHDYALQLTCKQIAHEMSGLALRRNTVHFKVEYSDEERISAARFDATMDISLVRLIDFLTPYDDGSLDFTPDIMDEVAREFPPMRPVFDAISLVPETFGNIDMCASEEFGIPLSVLLRAGWRTFGLALKHGSIPKTYSMLSYSDAKKAYATSQEFLPWHYNPSRKDFARMFGKARMFRGQGYRYWLKPHIHSDGDRQFTHGKFSFSAASKAIRFLSECPEQVRMQLRRICLHETATSVAFPECHALGLIPFCQENPCLYIERRVNLWRTLLQTPMDYYILRWRPEIYLVYNEDHAKDGEESANGARLSSERISLMFAHWAMEALELLRSGMPRRCFKLVIDGDPAPQLATRLFRDIIQRDATWQRVIEVANSALRSEHPTEKSIPFYLSHSPAYFFDGFSDMVDAIAGQKHELIECAFETGPSPWDVTAFSRQFRYFPPGLERFDEICDAYKGQPLQYFDMPHPLPSWIDLLAENILPEYFDYPDEEVKRVDTIHLYDCLGDVGPGTTEDELITDDTDTSDDEDDTDSSDDEDDAATSDDEGGSDGESPPGDDSEAEEDARSYDGGENDD